MAKVTITDGNGDKHEANVVANGEEGQFKLVCTNSGDILATGNEWTGVRNSRLVEIFAADPIFNDQLYLQVEEQFND